MPNFTYSDNIPFPTNNPSVDQPFMRTNTNSINSIIGIDHFPFNNNFGGTHQQVQIRNQNGTINGTIPPLLQGNGWETIYSSDTAGVGELWFVRGATATGIQLTGPGTPTALSQGYTFLPGGILIKWGLVNIGNGFSRRTTNENFAPQFPNNCFNIQFTLKASSSSVSSSDNTISVVSFDKTKFVWLYNGTSSTNYPDFYWVAIGN